MYGSRRLGHLRIHMVTLVCPVSLQRKAIQKKTQQGGSDEAHTSQSTQQAVTGGEGKAPEQ